MSSIEMAGWTVLGVGGVGLLINVARQITSGRRSRQVHQRELEVLGERLEKVRAARNKVAAEVQSWNGSRKFRVEKKQEEKGGICSFYLTPHDGKLPLPAFDPGQFLTFQLSIGGKGVTRCYSLSDAPFPDYYRVSIKRCLPPRDKPDAPAGLASSHFHDSVNEGDILDVLAPRGKFAIDPGESGPLVLSGSGVGVTPVLSMMNSLIAEKSRREIWFFYGVRNGSENMIKDEVAAWKALNLPNVHVHVCYSDPGEGEEVGAEFQHASRVEVSLFKTLLPSNNFDYYTCGPGPMMQGIRDGLAEWGVPEANVHDEAFIAVKKSVDVAAATVEFKKSEKSIEVSGSATNLLDLANEEGVDIPSGCCAGSCGTCETAILSGKVKYESPPEFSVEKGSCLPCVCLPEGDLALDA
ncbi:2Fe-2S iron-sulfur cluster-binding protein [Haloferula sp.]|uniref:2Fe-2S iron-sulfur cluster-binding protein n=1 Tax=Haloferula sp. TaxID=2497595 RepID=UPI00329AB071